MKKLFRSRSNFVFGGVCGGLADYFDMDSTIFRLLFIIFTCFTGFPLLLYAIMWAIIPIETI